MRKAFLVFGFIWATLPAFAQHAGLTSFIAANYTKKEVYIPMRDGTKLFTAIYTPKDASETTRYPMVLTRTCYAIAPYGEGSFPAVLGPNGFMTREKYIFVYQDVRGRYMSEGTWTNVRPFNPHKTGTEIDEASDTYDTIEWLLQNAAFNNGKVGQWGISYPGFFTTMGALSGHPALVAASPQAPVTDFYFEDFHHNGALTQGYFYTYPLFGIQTGGPTKEDWWEKDMVKDGLPDDYTFQLSLGSQKNVTERYYKDNFFWQEIINHPNYDAFWRKRGVAQHLKSVKPAMMTVGGWFDAEDLYGPLTVYKTIEKHNPQTYNTLVMGPFAHGQWNWDRRAQAMHGDLYFGDSLATFYQRNIESVFFKHWLKGAADGKTGLPDAYLFDTGAKKWAKFDHWPAAAAEKRKLYFHPSGKLDFTAPPAKGGFSEYISDPMKPVPSRCLVPTIEGLTMFQYMSDDQRCMSTRPDVLTFQTDVLTEDLTLSGELMARLKVAVTGTDADFVVKLIDVYPSNEKNHKHMPHKNIHLAGYQQMVRSEIMRGRYRNDFTEPKAMVPNKVTDFNFALQDVLHTFKKGHRIMIQVQSTFFPAFDRNPQKFVPNIYFADDKDFVKASHRVYHSAQAPSFLEVQVLK